MSEETTVLEDTASSFVHAFHADLTSWFSGTGERDAVWARLMDATPADMTLVYPSGDKLSGARFLESIRDRFGSSPGFVASISDFELVRAGEGHAVVAYIEVQHGAQQSQSRNRRSALALLAEDSGALRWRYIQETALPG